MGPFIAPRFVRLQPRWGQVIAFTVPALTHPDGIVATHTTHLLLVSLEGTGEGLRIPSEVPSEYP